MKDLLVGIDDSKINQLIFEETAKILNIDVVTAGNGIEGYSKIISLITNNNIPKIIITDIYMPEMDGIQLLEKLKTHDTAQYIPVLVLTTENDYQLKIRGKNLGAAGWLTKPFSPEEIASILKRFL